MSESETHSVLIDQAAHGAPFDVIQRRQEIESLAEESLKLMEEIRARHAILHTDEAQGSNYTTVTDNRIPDGMEAYFNPPP